MTPVQHVREAVLDGLKTQLERIVMDGTVTWALGQAFSNSAHFADGFTVAKMEQDGFSLTSLPQILIVPRSESRQRDGAGGSVGRYLGTMTVLLDCWIKSWDMAEDLSRVVHDVEKVLGLDYTLGGTCRDLRVDSNRTFIGEDERPLCGVQIITEFDYGYYENDPAVLV